MDTQAEALGMRAGAAGLSAARRLADGGRRVVVLEARDRIGGRVWTDHNFGPVPVERGAEFIHGERAETWAWVQRAKLTTASHARWSGRRIALGDGRLASADLLHERPDLRPVFDLEDMLAAYDGPDCSLADWLAANNFSALAAHIADVRLAHANCATPATISVAELAHEIRLDDKGPGDFHILEGYDRVLATIAAGLDIHLDTPVTTIHWGTDGAAALTSRGTFTAGSVVVTLPLALLKAGAVLFDPPLPEEKQHAIAALAMRPAMKVLL